MHSVKPAKNGANNARFLARQTGAATVEFAFALIALMLFFGIYMQFVQLFIAHERSIFAGFTAARTFMVEGTGPALDAAGRIDPEAAVDIIGTEVVISRDVPIPAGLDRLLTQGQGKFTFTYRSPTQREPRPNDDNPFPY